MNNVFHDAVHSITVAKFYTQLVNDDVANKNTLMSLYFFQNLLEPKIQLLCSVSAHVNEVVPDII